MEMERRDLLRGAAVGALGMAMGATIPAMAGEAASTQTEGKDTSAVPEGEGGERKLTFEEVDALRKQYVDAHDQDYVCEDGTVIPAVYVKLRALMYTMGLGLCDEVDDHSFDILMLEFTEEEAELYLSFPQSQFFSAVELSQITGKDEAECLEILDDLCMRGTLYHTNRSGIDYFHTVPEIHGYWEYSRYRIAQMPEDEAIKWSQAHVDFRPRPWEYFYSAGTPNYFPIPCDRNVVAENEAILPYEDYEKIIERNSIFAVSNCACHWRAELLGQGDPDWPWPMERCLSMGEEAEYVIKRGSGRQITKEEALANLKNSVECGMVLQSAFNKQNGAICQCHGAVCGFLKSLVALGEHYPDCNAAPYVGHYRIQYDQDACLSCGACADRCPLYAITMDDDGHPQVGPTCVGCGQCAYICPAEARKLVMKQDENFPEFAEDYLDDQNIKAEYRFRNGLIR